MAAKLYTKEKTTRNRQPPAGQDYSSDANLLHKKHTQLHTTYIHKSNLY